MASAYGAFASVIVENSRQIAANVRKEVHEEVHEEVREEKRRASLALVPSEADDVSRALLAVAAAEAAEAAESAGAGAGAASGARHARLPLGALGNPYDRDQRASMSTSPTATPRRFTEWLGHLTLSPEAGVSFKGPRKVSRSLSSTRAAQSQRSGGHSGSQGRSEQGFGDGGDGWRGVLGDHGIARWADRLSRRVVRAS